MKFKSIIPDPCYFLAHTLLCGIFIINICNASNSKISESMQSTIKYEVLRNPIGINDLLDTKNVDPNDVKIIKVHKIDKHFNVSQNLSQVEHHIIRPVVGGGTKIYNQSDPHLTSHLKPGTSTTNFNNDNQKSTVSGIRHTPPIQPQTINNTSTESTDQVVTNDSFGIINDISILNNYSSINLNPNPYGSDRNASEILNSYLELLNRSSSDPTMWEPFLVPGRDDNGSNHSNDTEGKKRQWNFPELGRGGEEIKKYYEISIGNSSKTLMLQRKLHLISPLFKMVVVQENHTSVELKELTKFIKEEKNENDCYNYFGQIVGENTSYASIYECQDTLQGVIKSEGIFYDIHPINVNNLPKSRRFRRSLHTGSFHLVKPLENKRSKRSTHDAFNPDDLPLICPFNDPVPIPNITSDQAWLDWDTYDKEIILDIAVFCSKELLQKIYQRSYILLREKSEEDQYKILQKYIKNLMSVVQILYLHSSLGETINVRISYLAILPNRWATHKDDTVDSMLNDFSRYQYHERLKSADQHWDIAILLTEDPLIIRRSSEMNRAIGYANTQSVCRPEKGVLISNNEGFKTSLIVAHEMAHTLGAEHDGYRTSADCDPINHLMSSQFQGTYTEPWSQCTRRNIKINIRSFSCLFKDKVGNISELMNLNMKKNTYPGEFHSTDKQCKFAYGKDAKPYYDPYRNICQALMCQISGTNIIKKSPHPALEGTTCARGKWCISGECVSKNSNNNQRARNSLPNDHFYNFPSAVNGNWGSWKPDQVCKYYCLQGSVGTRLVKRKCDNPSPQMGGRGCFGITQSLSKCQPDPHVCNSLITNNKYADQVCKRLSPRYKGYQIPYEETHEESASCAIHCRDGSFEQRYAYFPDGTLCNKHPSDFKYCINGNCRSTITNV